jgi:hypothetical protein
MGVYIPGMEMPTDRSRWVVIYPDGRVDYSDKTDEWETLDERAVPVPEHGRLIDEKDIVPKDGYIIADGTACIPVKDIVNAPTIIPADGRGTNVPTREEGE